jgi:hypothetical protein
MLVAFGQGIGIGFALFATPPVEGEPLQSDRATRPSAALTANPQGTPAIPGDIGTRKASLRGQGSLWIR